MDRVESKREDIRQRLDCLPLNVERLIEAWETPDPDITDKGMSEWIRDLNDRMVEVHDLLDDMAAVAKHDLWTIAIEGKE